MLTLQLPDQICNSPYCQPYNSYNVSSENLGSTNYPQIYIFLYSYHLADWYCVMFKGEILSWSLTGVKGLTISNRWVETIEKFESLENLYRKKLADRRDIRWLKPQ